MELIRQEKDTNWTAPWASTSLVSMHGHSLHCYCVLRLAVNFRGECAKSNSDEVLARLAEWPAPPAWGRLLPAMEPKDLIPKMHTWQ